MATQTITYEITQVQPDELKVEYSDGSYAFVPVFADDTREVLFQRISDFNPTPLEAFNSVAEVPVSLGETGVVTRVEEEEIEPQPEPLLDYENLRTRNYPTVFQVVSALYENSIGNTAPLEAVWQAVAEVNEEFPETMDPIPEDEYLASLENV